MLSTPRWGACDVTDSAPSGLAEDVEPHTPLQRQLRYGVPRGRPTALEAFAIARRTFLRGERIEMNALAAELGINRVTLYRWVGSREELLVEILWSLAEHTLENRLEGLDNATGTRVAGLLAGFVDDVLSNAGMRRFLRDESDLAMRLLTLASGGFQSRLVGLVRRLLAEDVDTGRFATPVPLDDLAFTAVRIVESYVHLHAITGEDPDADRAGRVLHALLR